MKTTDIQKAKKWLINFLLEDLGNSETSRKILNKLNWKELSHLSLKINLINYRKEELKVVSNISSNMKKLMKEEK